MDGDPSQEDRIRLIGRLFFIFSMRDVNLRSFAYAKVFSFMQDLGYFCHFLWARKWTNGQNRGQQTTMDCL
jgi:hypothetical protein